jgi:hypothetical protein
VRKFIDTVDSVVPRILIASRRRVVPRSLFWAAVMTDPGKQVDMYIGLGTLVVILVIAAIIYLVRRA